MRTDRGRWIVGLATVALGALATPSRPSMAQAPSAAEHYTRGSSFYDLGKYSEAITEFEMAYQIKQDPALIYNIAQAKRLQK